MQTLEKRMAIWLCKFCWLNDEMLGPEGRGRNTRADRSYREARSLIKEAGVNYDKFRKDPKNWPGGRPIGL